MDIAGMGGAFVEGIWLVASPSILNVLPLMFLASVASGRKSPPAICIGFVLSFALLALYSHTIQGTLHIGLYYIRTSASILLLIFSIVWMSDLSRKTQEGEGFFGGILVGALTGPLWMPYAETTLREALNRAALGQADLASALIIAACAFGAAVTMLLIMLAGKAIIHRLPYVAKRPAGLRKACGTMMIFCVVITSLSIDAQTVAQGIAEARAEEEKTRLHPYPVPELAGIEAWFNSQPLTLGSLKGKVVLIDFWDYACANCLNALPYVTSWDSRYRGKGLVIIGVSSPEFSWEKNPQKVKAAMKRYGIEYPVALDNRLATWDAFHNKFWPAVYLINRQGEVVYTHFGERNYDVTENAIRSLLGLAGK